MNYYFHNVPGRLRVKIPTLKGRPAGIKAVEDILLNLAGTERLKTNSLTGSVVINYDPDLLNAQQIIQLLIDHQYFDASNAITHDELVQNAAAEAGFKIGKMLIGWAVGKTLETNGLSMLAAII
jgi:Heavy metal associated domain 2